MFTRPYVGITGITTAEHVQNLLESPVVRGWPSSEWLMLGILASYKGLAFDQIADPQQYAPVSELNELAVADARVLSLVHYNSRARGLARQLDDVMARVSYADGVQLNIPWVSVIELKRWRRRVYGTCALQVSSSAYKLAGGTPERLVRRLASYEGSCEYVLLDPSGGTGSSFEVSEIRGCLEALIASGLDMHWGVAGGLDASTLPSLRPLLELYPELSWDAQGRLRTDGALDLAKCQAYLEASHDLIAEYRP